MVNYTNRMKRVDCHNLETIEVIYTTRSKFNAFFLCDENSETFYAQVLISKNKKKNDE